MQAVSIALILSITVVKKITIVILAILYITTSSGVIVNMHYCMGKLVALDFLHHKDQHCFGCGMEETNNKDCCKQEKKILKTEKDQKTTILTAFQLPQHIFTQIDDYFDIASVHVTCLKVSHPLYYAPPRGHSLQRFIRYCDFRI